MEMDPVFKFWTGYLASGIEAVAALLVALAAIQATINALPIFLHRQQIPAMMGQEPKTELIRLRFGRWLALALEFELGADILRTAITPTWYEIGQLAAIATIRTALNYFLQQEIDRAAERQEQLLRQQRPDGLQQQSTPESTHAPADVSSSAIAAVPSIRKQTDNVYQ